MFSSMIRMPSVRKVKEKEDVGGQGVKEETNWNNLPNELKHACVKEMTIETRWKLRQTSHNDRSLVDSVRLYADDIYLCNNFLTLTRNTTTLMIHFKFHREKYIPFLVYLFTVLELKKFDPLKVKTESLWNLIYERLPHREGIPKAKEVLPIPPGIILPRFTKSDMQKIKIQRWLRDVRHQVFGSDPEDWYHLFVKIAVRTDGLGISDELNSFQDWQNFPPVVGAEIIVYDSEIKTKKLQKFIKFALGKFFVEDGYEQAFIGTTNLERIMYLYREPGSNWYHIVMRAVEPDDFVNTERWKEMKTFNYKFERN